MRVNEVILSFSVFNQEKQNRITFNKNIKFSVHPNDGISFLVFLFSLFSGVSTVFPS